MTKGKECFKCRETKSPEDFYPGRNECKKCHTATHRRYYRANAERIRLRERMRYYAQTGRPGMTGEAKAK
jgi:hypothetical protein